MKELCDDHTQCTIRNMIQALEYQRDRLWDDKEGYYRNGNSDEWNELNETLTTMIMALSL